jgi:small toxic polypeptide LdrA/B/C/D
MVTYLILNIIVIIFVCVVFAIRPHRPSRQWLVMLGCLLFLTLVFDNIMIALDMFTYADDKILGIHIFLAPIEDFMYAILAAIVIPSIWNKLGRQDDR